MKALIKILSILLVTFLFTSCDCSDCETKLKTAETQLQKQLDTNRQTANNEEQAKFCIFGSSEGNYCSDLKSIRKITLPYSDFDIDGDGTRDILVIQQKETIYLGSVTSNGAKKHVILEVVHHGNSDFKGPMHQGFKTYDHAQMDDFSTKIPANSYTNKENIWLITLHDEDYPFPNNPNRQAQVHKAIMDMLTACDLESGIAECPTCITEIQSKIDKILYDDNTISKTRPGTIGGGVIPPR